MLNKNKTNNHHQYLALFNAIDALSTKYHLTKDQVIKVLKSVITKVYQDTFTDAKLDILIDVTSQSFHINKIITVVADDYYEQQGNDDYEINIATIKKQFPNVKVGDTITKDISNDLDSLMLHKISQLFISKIKEEVATNMNANLGNLLHSVVNGTIISINSNLGITYVKVGNNNAILLATQAIANEKLTIGKTYQFYVLELNFQDEDYPLILSRKDPQLVSLLLRAKVPLIQDGTIEIIKVARIAAVNTKLLLKSNNPSINPVDACIDFNKSLIHDLEQAVFVSNLKTTERIALIAYSDNPITLISNACSPTKLVGIQIINKQSKKANVIVHEKNYSALIGNKGTNIKLICVITGWAVNIMKVQDAQAMGIDYIKLNNEQ